MRPNVLALRAAHGIKVRTRPADIQDTAKNNFAQWRRCRQQTASMSPAANKKRGVSGRTKVPRPTIIPVKSQEAACEYNSRWSDGLLGEIVDARLKAIKKVNTARVVRKVERTSVRSAAL